jgi:hypothetical protein
LNPLFAMITGAQPAHTFSAMRTVLSASGAYADVPFTSQLRTGDVVVLLDRRHCRVGRFESAFIFASLSCETREPSPPP